MTADRRRPRPPESSSCPTEGGLAGKVPSGPGRLPGSGSDAEDQTTPPRQKTGEGDAIARAHALIAAAFERIAASWVEGAERSPAERDDAIDQTARAGDLAALTAALRAYERATADAGARMRTPAAVRLMDTVIGEVWLMADSAVLDETPDAAGSGIASFTFAEFTVLLGQGVEALRAAAVVRRAWPTAAILSQSPSRPSLADGTAERPLDPPREGFKTFWKRSGRTGRRPDKNPQSCAVCGRVTWRIVLNHDPLHHVRVMEPLCNACWVQRVRDAEPHGGDS